MAVPSPPAQGQRLQGVPRCPWGDVWSVCSENDGKVRSVGRQLFGWHLQSEGFRVRSGRAMGMEPGAHSWNGTAGMALDIWDALLGHPWCGGHLLSLLSLGTWSCGAPSPTAALLWLSGNCPGLWGGELAVRDGRWKDVPEQSAPGPSIPVSCIRTAPPWCLSVLPGGHKDAELCERGGSVGVSQL